MRRHLPAPARRTVSRVLLAVAAVLAVPAEAGAAPVGPAASSRAAQPVPDAALSSDLDAVLAFSPPSTCLRVVVDGEALYDREGSTPLVPASTLKLLTGAVALDQLGPDHRFRTRLVAAAAPVDGTITGDLALVGGGDPTLVTDAYRLVMRIGDDQPSTSLDALADELVASGVRRITGRVVGDESRYDRLRTVPSWPERYARQGQAGPLSALSVDDGAVLRATGDDSPPERDRSTDPPGDAARLLAVRLVERGVQVDAAPLSGAGVAPAGGVEVGRATSAPLADIVRHLLLASDNREAELVAKELGVVVGGGGTTAEGAGVIARGAAELGIDTAGATIVDGSGLDPGNRLTCQGLTSALDVTGGITGTLGPSLPVAGASGTLATRFRGTPAEGRLRAKTGSLSGTTSLAGFVELPGGAVATFAYVANADPVPAEVRRAQDVLADVLARFTPTCAAPGAPGLVAPVAPYAGQVGTLAMFPLQSVLVPGALLPLHVFEDRYRTLVDRCLALEEDFGVVLIERGSEVGGEDQRSLVGTRARILEARQAPDGRWAVIAAGLSRLRVDRWLPDDPHPLAEVTEWPDPPAPSSTADALEASTTRLRRVLALRTELGEPGPPATVDLSIDLTDDDPTLASYRLVGLSPVGDLDRQRLLAAPDIGDRLLRLDALLQEEEDVCRARLGGG